MLQKSLLKLVKVGSIALTLWSSHAFAGHYIVFDSNQNNGIPLRQHNLGCNIYNSTEDINTAHIGSEEFANGEFWATGDMVACRSLCANWNKTYNTEPGFVSRGWDYRDFYTHQNVPNYWNGNKIETMYQCKTHQLAFSNTADENDAIRCSYRTNLNPQCNVTASQYPYPAPTCSMTLNTLKGVTNSTIFKATKWNATKEQYCRMNYKNGDSAIISCNATNFVLGTFARGTHNINLKVYGVVNSFIENLVNVVHRTTCTQTINVYDPPACSFTYSGPSTLSISAKTPFSMTSKATSNLADASACTYVKQGKLIDANYPCGSKTVSATADQVGSIPGTYNYTFAVYGKGGGIASCYKTLTLVK